MGAIATHALILATLHLILHCDESALVVSSEVPKVGKRFCCYLLPLKDAEE